MSSFEQSVTLLRRNKKAMVAALQDNGYAGVSEGMRAADFPMYARWGSGLLDLQVCAVKIEDGSVRCFSLSEWESLTAENKALFVTKGLRVRALGQDFIIAPTTILNQTYSDAVTNAAAYKAHTLENGVEDTAEWTLPTKLQAQIFYRYRKQIDAAFSKSGCGNSINQSWHWTKTLYSSGNYWEVHTGSGWYQTAASTSTMALRPVASTPV